MNERKSNIELFRIVCMIMIIAGHYCHHGGLLFEGNTNNMLLAKLLRLGGKLGVTGFVLITGYFMSEKEFKISSVIKVVMQTIFYSLLLLISYAVLGGEVSIGVIRGQLFSPIYNTYWFVTAYVGMYLLIPFLNTIVRNIHRGGVLVYLGITLSGIPFMFVNSNFMMTDVVWFCFLYLIGGYIKSNDVSIKNSWKVKWAFIISILFMWISSILINRIYEITHIEKLQNYIYYFSVMNSPFMLVAGISLFVFFKDLDISSKIVSVLGSTTFACYLLHENPMLRDFIWKELFHTEYFYDKSIIFVLLHMMMCIVLIFLTALITESVRKIIERKLFSMRIWNYIDEKLSRIIA